MEELRHQPCRIFIWLAHRDRLATNDRHFLTSALFAITWRRLVIYFFNAPSSNIFGWSFKLFTRLLRLVFASPTFGNSVAMTRSALLCSSRCYGTSGNARTPWLLIRNSKTFIPWSCVAPTSFTSGHPGARRLLDGYSKGSNY